MAGGGGKGLPGRGPPPACTGTGDTVEEQRRSELSWVFGVTASPPSRGGASLHEFVHNFKQIGCAEVWIYQTAHASICFTKKGWRIVCALETIE